MKSHARHRPLRWTGIFGMLAFFGAGSLEAQLLGLGPEAAPPSGSSSATIPGVPATAAPLASVDVAELDARRADILDHLRARARDPGTGTELFELLDRGLGGPAATEALLWPALRRKMTEAKGYSPAGLAAIERVRSGVVLVIRDLTRRGGTPAERSLVLLDAEYGRALTDATLWPGVRATLASRPGREATRLLPATHRLDPTPSYP